jgi:RHS repeat-associated protein
MKDRFIIVVLILVSLTVAAQGPATGTPPFGSFGGGPLDIVNLANLNVNINVPITQKAGRGAQFFYLMSYNNSIWYPALVNGVTTWQPVAGYGWQAQTNASVYGYISRTLVHGRCGPEGPFYWGASNFVYHDLKGATHSIVGADEGLDCDGTLYADSGATVDGTGLTYNLTADGTLNGKLVDRDGRVISLGDSVTPSSIDTNGNQITTDGTNYYDTLGSTALTLSGAPPNPVTYTFPNSNGGNSTVTANYTTFTVKTNFGCSGVAEYSASANLITSIVLPDNSQYVFTYEQTPGYGSGNTTGRIASVTLPSNGMIVYSYSGGSNGITCSDGSVAGLTRSLQSAPPATDGAWAYSRSGNTTTVIDPTGNQAFIQFQGIYETQRDIYPVHTEAVPALQTLYICYNGAAYPCTSSPVSLSIREITVTSNVNNFYSQTDTTYNSLGSPLVTKEYDFGSGAPGALLRETDFTYATINNGTIQDRPTDVIIKDGSGNRVAETQIAYDGASLTGTSGAPNHDYTNYSSSFAARGNPTSISQWVTGTTFNVTTNTYDDLGNLRSSTNPGGHQTTIDYTDNYSDGVNHNTQAFPTTITFPTTTMGTTYSHVLKSQYYWPSAMLYQATDQNNLVTTYTYDNMWRSSTINYPDGGKTTYFNFMTAGFPTWAVQNQIDSSGNTTDYSLLFDGLGRVSRAATYNGGEAAGAWDQEDFCYNANGQLSFSPYGYQGNGFVNQAKRCPPGNVGDSFAYDALGRQLSVTHSDGTSVVSSYNGRAVQIQDEGNGSGTRVTHVYQQDGLGRTVTACELASSIFGISSMPICGLDLAGNSNGVTTSYSYDPLDNVKQISQGGLLLRSMSYDGVGHLLTESIPEAGGTTTSYGYNSDGLLASRTRPSANQPASCIAQGNCITTTTYYSYDELDRLRIVSYADSASENTPGVAMFYDDSLARVFPPNGGYNMGRLADAYVTDKTFSQILVGSNIANDKMGRVAVEQQNYGNGPWQIYNVSHTYNLAGWPVTTGNGVGITFTKGYNAAGRLSQVSSSVSDAQHPATLFSAPHYNAGGELTADSLGNGVNESFNYDTRWRLLSAAAVNASGALYSLGGPGSGNTMAFAPNSSVTATNNSVNGNWIYSYDALNRIAGANNSGGTSFSFDVDRNANRWHQNPTGQGAQLAFDATTNHITNAGVIYDAVGNIINDGLHTYTYDAEGRITKVDGGTTAAYFYDAFGRRAQRTVGSVLYDEVYDGFNMIVETRASDGMVMRDEIYGPNSHLATYVAGTTYFSHKDWLGSERVRSDVNGNVAGTCTSFPYGDNYVCAGTDPSPIKYAGMEYDSESQLNHTLFRYYNPRLGLWMTPDPAGLGASSLSDPQSLNRYAYVTNGPSNLIDPTGLTKQKVCMLDDNGNETNVCVGADFLSDDPFGRGGASMGNLLLNYTPGYGFGFAGPGGFSISGGIGGVDGMRLPGTCEIEGGCGSGSLTYSGLGGLIGVLPSARPCDLGPVISENCGQQGGSTFSSPAIPWGSIPWGRIGAGALEGFLEGALRLAGPLSVLLMLTGDNAPSCQQQFNRCLNTSLNDLDGPVYGTGRCEECRQACVRNNGVWPSSAPRSRGSVRCDYWNR